MGVKVGVIGYGFGGEVFHMPLIESVEELTPVAVCTSDPERGARVRAKGYRVHATAEALIADPDIDLVVVTTPHDTHRDLTVRALSAGKHVVTDKPMCLSVQEAQEMIDASVRYGRMLSVFHNRRWDADYLLIKEYLTNHILGGLISIESWVRESVPPAEGWRSSRSRGGGVFSDWGAHLLDQLLTLDPTPLVSVYCHMEYAVPAVDVETHATCILQYEDGIRHTLHTSKLYHTDDKGFNVLGAGGRLEIHGFDLKGLRQRERLWSLPTTKPACSGRLYSFGKSQPVDIAAEGHWQMYYQNIADHLLRGAPLAVTPNSALRVMLTLDAAFRSAQTGQIVHCRI